MNVGSENSSFEKPRSPVNLLPPKPFVASGAGNRNKHNGNTPPPPKAFYSAKMIK